MYWQHFFPIWKKSIIYLNECPALDAAYLPFGDSYLKGDGGSVHRVLRVSGCCVWQLCVFGHLRVLRVKRPFFAIFY